MSRKLVDGLDNAGAQALFVVESNSDGGYDLYRCRLELVEHHDRSFHAVAAAKRGPVVTAAMRAGLTPMNPLQVADRGTPHWAYTVTFTDGSVCTCCAADPEQAVRKAMHAADLFGVGGTAALGWPT